MSVRGFCLGEPGNEIFNGNEWQALPGPQLLVASCGSESFCVGANNAGEVAVFTGGSWTSLAKVAPSSFGYPAISCTKTEFCALVGRDGEALIYSEHSWISSKTIDTSEGVSVGLTGVSCVSRVFCIAIDDWGRAVAYNGSEWGPPVLIEREMYTRLETVSCASTSFCEAFDERGTAFTYTAP